MLDSGRDLRFQMSPVFCLDKGGWDLLKEKDARANENSSALPCAGNSTVLYDAVCLCPILSLHVWTMCVLLISERWLQHSRSRCFNYAHICRKILPNTLSHASLLLFDDGKFLLNLKHWILKNETWLQNGIIENTCLTEHYLHYWELPLVTGATLVNCSAGLLKID